MAEAPWPVSEDQFWCPVCLDQLRDPVTTACGHTFCMSCLNSCWDEDPGGGLDPSDPGGLHRCPQCRQAFPQRPALRRNVMMADLVETLEKAALGTDPDSGDVDCDLCSGRKLRAVRSCLTCRASFCRTHLRPHHTSPALQDHRLVHATARLRHHVCPRHLKPLDLYCRDDQICICVLCTVEEHAGHRTAPAETERTERQKQLKETRKKSQQMIQQKEKQLQELRKAVASHKRSAQAAVEDSKMVFGELLRLVERRCSEVTALIRAQEKEMVRRTEGILRRMEQEVAELRRRDAQLEELSHTEDLVQFLQSFQSLSATPASALSHTITVAPQRTFMDVAKPVRELRKKLEEFCRAEIQEVSRRVTEVRLLEPTTRKEFLEYSCQLTLDPNTANGVLCVWEGGSEVSWDGLFRFYPPHPERFEPWPQVLCGGGVCGRGYWEVEWSGSQGVGLAVSYRGIGRKTDYECVFGCNAQSWSLSCLPSGFSFWHDSQETPLPRAPSSSRIGMFVDRRAGTLSFYSISDSMTLIHRVQTTFTEPLYPGFRLDSGSKVTLLPLTE